MLCFWRFWPVFGQEHFRRGSRSLIIGESGLKDHIHLYLLIIFVLWILGVNSFMIRYLGPLDLPVNPCADMWCNVPANPTEWDPQLQVELEGP